jgi:predicted dehydrogenase
MPGALRLGLAGAGRWGRNYIRTIAGLPELRLTHVASRNPSTAALLPAGCRLVAHWSELIDPSALDGVIIATPPASHGEIARAAILAGIPVLIEKPLALSAAEARDVRDLAVEQRVFALVEHTHLFSPAFRTLKQLVERHGGAREIHSEASSQGPYRRDVSVLWDWGPHDVAMCLDLMQEVPTSAASAVQERFERNGGVAETVSIALSFRSGVAAHILLSNMKDKKRRISVRCRDATLIYDDAAKNKLAVGSNDGKQTTVAVAEELPLTVACREFAGGITARRAHDLDLGVKVVEVLETCAGHHPRPA